MPVLHSVLVLYIAKFLIMLVTLYYATLYYVMLSYMTMLHYIMLCHVIMFQCSIYCYYALVIICASVTHS